MENDIYLFKAKIFGHRLREFRIGRDETREEFAEATDMAPNHIGEIERGEKLPRTDTLLKLRKIGLDVNGILDNINQELSSKQ